MCRQLPALIHQVNIWGLSLHRCVPEPSSHAVYCQPVNTRAPCCPRHIHTTKITATHVNFWPHMSWSLYSHIRHTSVISNKWILQLIGVYNIYLVQMQTTFQNINNTKPCVWIKNEKSKISYYCTLLLSSHCQHQNTLKCQWCIMLWNDHMLGGLVSRTLIQICRVNNWRAILLMHSSGQPK